MNKVIITGSSGLIGSEAVKYFCKLGWYVLGIDCNAREEFFGPEGSVLNTGQKLIDKYPDKFVALNIDIRDARSLQAAWVAAEAAGGDDPVKLVLHFAAQPSHDYSVQHPANDFYVNAVGTVNVLEVTRQLCPEAVFIYTSTSKVYGTHVNKFSFIEKEDRMDYYSAWLKGVDENVEIDKGGCIHSLFGASKLAADIMVQEYGNYYGMRTAVLRPGCMTGSGHAGVELHGFLSYLIKCVVEGREYKIFDETGGKRVRDNIHSYDVVTACYEIFKSPPKPGEVFNIGGGRANSISIKEALRMASTMIGKEAVTSIHPPRRGDHYVYITDNSKFMGQYTNWELTYDLKRIFSDIIQGYKPV